MQQLGIQPILLLAQIVNFAIIVYFLNKLLYKPIIGLIEKRRKEIAESVKRAQEVSLEEEKVKEKADKLMENARKEAKHIIDEAKKQARDKELEIVADAHQEAHGIISEGKKEVEQLHKTLEKRLRAETVDLAVQMVKHLLPSILTGPQQHKLVEKQLRELETKSVKLN